MFLCKRRKASRSFTDSRKVGCGSSHSSHLYSHYSRARGRRITGSRLVTYTVKPVSKTNKQVNKQKRVKREHMERIYGNAILK
jgi:hypothetical protein